MLWKDSKDSKARCYNEGYQSFVASEAEGYEGALPKRGNNPQKCAFGLYAEQLSGTAFTAPRAENLRSWLYRIRPSVGHSPLVEYQHAGITASFAPGAKGIVPTPAQLRWDPFSMPDEAFDKVDFVDGLKTISGAGSAQMRDGLSISVFACSKDMGKRAFYNSDGDFLIVPQQGRLEITTEFGSMSAGPGDIVLISRGMKFTIDLPDQLARGFVLEVFGQHFTLPELGPIGANSLAQSRDFKSPTAAFVDVDEEWEIINKYMGGLFQCTQTYCPYDVVAYHGNYVPYKYDLAMFTPIGAILFDHPDPSIFTVLTCKSNTPGVAVADFVYFPERWCAQEDTFRPPYFHRNCMSEFMINVAGTYDAKAGGFLPGGASLHSMNTAHGPDVKSFDGASNAELKPVKIATGSIACMFESCYQLALTEWAMEGCGVRQKDYHKVWQPFTPHFRVHKRTQA